MGLGDLWNGLLRGLGSSLGFFYDLIPNYGVAIILLTLAVKIVTLPLTIKQTRATQAMAKLQPETARIKAKYKGDMRKANEEVAKLYQEHGVNPLGGCLPVLLQMPVLFALFQVFQRCGVSLPKGRACPPEAIGTLYLPKTSALRKAMLAGQASFLGMNLGVSPVQAYRIDGVLGAVPFFLVIALMALSSWYQQKQMTSAQSTPQTAQMQMMGRMMVFMFPLLAVGWPIALSVYWTTSNLWTIAQQYLLLGKDGKGGWMAKFPSPFGPAEARIATESTPAENGRGKTGSVSGNGKPAATPKGTGARKPKKKRR